MNTEIYLYIPWDKILNKIKRKHRTKDFRDIYFYRNKNKYVFNEKNIKEIDIYKSQKIQTNTFYKDNYKSQIDKYFDWYKVLKPKYNDCDEVYIKTKEKRDNTYKKNKFKQLKKKIEYNKLKKNSQHNNKISKKSFIVDFS